MTSHVANRDDVIRTACVTLEAMAHRFEITDPAMLRDIAADLRATLPAPSMYPQPVEPPWMAIARAEIGVKEVAGKEDHPRIIEYLKTTNFGGSLHDEVPWCAAFVSWCLEQAGIRSTRRANARSYLVFGDECEVKPGAIVVMRRGDSQTQGHVGFVAQYSAKTGTIKVLGGNQRNQACERWMSATEVLSIRWPAE